MKLKTDDELLGGIWQWQDMRRWRRYDASRAEFHEALEQLIRDLCR